MKKLLLITSELPPQPGGIGTHAHQLASYLSKSYEVTVLADQRSGAGDEEKSFDRQQDYKIIRVQRKKLIFFTYINRIRKALKFAKQSDIVLVSGKFPLWVGGMIKININQLPVIGIIHGSEVLLSNIYLKKLTDKSLQKLDAIIGVSSYTLSLVKYLALKNTYCIPNGIEVYSSIPLVKAITKNQHLHFITVGNLTQRKGQHNFINALPKLVEVYPNLTYHIVGIPTNEQQILKLANALGVEKHIQLHGRVSEEKKNKLLSKAHVFVMLSERTPSGDVEGFGIAILEANLYGLPALGSKDSGIEEAIRDGYSGRLVHPHNTEEITEALNEIIQKYPAYAKQASLHAQQFDWNKVVLKYKEVIEDCLGS